MALSPKKVKCNSKTGLHFFDLVFVDDLHGKVCRCGKKEATFVGSTLDTTVPVKFHTKRKIKI